MRIVVISANRAMSGFAISAACVSHTRLIFVLLIHIVASEVSPVRHSIVFAVKRLRRCRFLLLGEDVL